MLKLCNISWVLIPLSLFALPLPSVEKKAERSEAFFSTEGSGNSFNFNTVWL